MPIRIRHFKNKRRGTELTYATLPTEEAININEQDVKREFGPFYGQGIDYKDLTRKVQNFSSSDQEEEVLSLWKKDAKNFYELETGNYLTLKKIGKRIVFTPAPAVHDIMLTRVPFDKLLKVLEEGFKSENDNGENAKIKRGRNYRFTGWGGHSSEEDLTKGDLYSLELFADEKSTVRPYHYRIEKSAPNRILSVNVALNPTSSEDNKKAKMKFYKEKITDKYGIPVRFFETSGSWEKYIGGDSLEHERIKDYKIGKRILSKYLEQKVTSIITIAGLGAGIFLLSSNITGNVIGSQGISNGIGSVLLVVGLVAGFFWLKNKKK